MSYFYLATPYSKYPHGLEAAFALACDAAAIFLRAGIPVYSPIAHSHAIATRGDISATNAAFWLQAHRPMMEQAFGLIVLCAENWDQSHGIAEEVKIFLRAGKPVRYWQMASLHDKPALAALALLLRARKINAATVKTIARLYFGLSEKDMVSPSRRREHAWPRQMAMALTREFTDYSLPMIGKEFGGRDHTTVLYALRIVAERTARDAQLLADLESLRAALRRYEGEKSADRTKAAA